MKTKPIELEGAQRGGASKFGGEAVPDYLIELRGMIGDIRTIASEIYNLTLFFDMWKTTCTRAWMDLIEIVNSKLKDYVAELKKGRRLEMCCLLSKLRTDSAFWAQCNAICDKMGDKDGDRALGRVLDELKMLLEEVKKTTREFGHDTFEKFFMDEKNRFSECGVQGKFNDWLYEHDSPTMKELRELQAQVVAAMLKTGVLDHAPTPSQKEIKQVKVDYLRELLPYDFDMNQKFIIACAKWRRLMHWEGTILVINYAKYGKYIQDHYCDLNGNHKRAIFELDMMLSLIHREMGRLKTEKDEDTSEAIFKYIHPAVDSDHEWAIHRAVERLVRNHRIADICDYLLLMAREEKILLPKSVECIYAELVRLGMPTDKGFSMKNFKNYYSTP